MSLKRTGCCTTCIMIKRVMGKASFCNVQDLEGNIQVYVARNEICEEPFDEYKDFKKMDIGDIVANFSRRTFNNCFSSTCG